MDLTHIIQRATGRHAGQSSRLLTILREVQDQAGSLPPEAIDCVAAALGLPRVQAEATASFYHLLHNASHGLYEILFSDNVVDQMAGQQELMHYLCDELLLQPGKVSHDGLVYVGTTSDIGLADQAPAALVNGRALPSLDQNRLGLIADLVRTAVPLPQWPGMLFEVAANVRKGGPLLGEPFTPGAALARARALGPEWIIAEVDASGLRGRGGAGYKTAAKWLRAARPQARLTTSSATPTKASPALSRTVCCCRATPIWCSRV